MKMSRVVSWICVFVQVLNLELATVNEEKIKLKRKSDELEAKLQVAQAAKEEANLAVEKKEYLETKVNKGKPSRPK